MPLLYANVFNAQQANSDNYCQSGTDRSDLFVPKLTCFVDCTRLLKCCTFRVERGSARFRVPEGDFVSEACDETR